MIRVNGATLTESYLTQRAIDLGLPHYMDGALWRYLEHGISPGSFLRAVLENNLCEAVACADNENGAKLKEWVCLLYQDCPSDAWGSPEKVKDWMKQRQEAHHDAR